MSCESWTLGIKLKERDMRKFRFLNASKDKRNFVVGLLASNSKKPAINYLSSRIFFELDRRFKRNNNTYYCEISAVQIVHKILETIHNDKTKNLLIGMFTPKEELKLLVYAELYKLSRLGFVKIKKVKKYLWVKLTEKGINNIFRFLELDMGDDMRKFAESKGYKVLESGKFFNDPRPYASGFRMIKKTKKDIN
jgi:hypothetical protein